MGHKSCSASLMYTFNLSRPGQYPSHHEWMLSRKASTRIYKIYTYVLLSLHSVSIIRVLLHQFLAMCWSSHGFCTLSFNTCQWWDSHCTSLIFCNYLVWVLRISCPMFLEVIPILTPLIWTLAAHIASHNLMERGIDRLWVYLSSIQHKNLTHIGLRPSLSQMTWTRLIQSPSNLLWCQINLTW